MKAKLLKQIPWALCSYSIQLFILWSAYYLYDNDYGYNSGRTFSYFLSYSYFVLGAAGLLGVICGIIGMNLSIKNDSWVKVSLKIVFIYIPCLFLSVLWCYLWLVLTAWI